MTYIGRFAPSPTGPLHAGSLVAALASWLDARAHGGCWLVRIEDVDATRCHADLPRRIMRQLLQHALVPDAEPAVQSQRHAQYQQALNQLIGRSLAYPCTCSRKQIAGHWAGHGQSPQRHGERVYPGTCRPQRGAAPAPVPAQPHAWRLDIAACLQRQGLPADAATVWNDRRLGAQQQVVTQAVGDFVLRRADGLWAYQLAVVVDDADQGVTHVVRGEDLADNTARQIVLQQALDLPTPRYLHTPLVRGTNGEKLSKQNGAEALPEGQEPQALANLQAAARVLDLPPAQAATPHQALAQWTDAWRRRWAD
ncbi:MAG: tRNA glutamyl-Q(34) synthetase GluQRS [Brachymonas sp.]|jgi:glutamyl-Q tRNA(Asp) synthetase|nr:tRNA glutamyl-Q(34) synthetase GluQRS [Brachymonas sp.]MBP9652582.1 tRNA glutamyl-Q(34) synthetase GluQRS [Brachymonas sp.]